MQHDDTQYFSISGSPSLILMGPSRLCRDVGIFENELQAANEATKMLVHWMSLVLTAGTCVAKLVTPIQLSLEREVQSQPLLSGPQITRFPFYQDYKSYSHWDRGVSHITWSGPPVNRIWIQCLRLRWEGLTLLSPFLGSGGPYEESIHLPASDLRYMYLLIKTYLIMQKRVKTPPFCLSSITRFHCFFLQKIGHSKEWQLCQHTTHIVYLSCQAITIVQ